MAMEKNKILHAESARCYSLMCRLVRAVVLGWNDRCIDIHGGALTVIGTYYAVNSIDTKSNNYFS